MCIIDSGEDPVVRPAQAKAVAKVRGLAAPGAARGHRADAGIARGRNQELEPDVRQGDAERVEEQQPAMRQLSRRTAIGAEVKAIVGDAHPTRAEVRGELAVRLAGPALVKALEHEHELMGRSRRVAAVGVQEASEGVHAVCLAHQVDDAQLNPDPGALARDGRRLGTARHRSPGYLPSCHPPCGLVASMTPRHHATVSRIPCSSPTIAWKPTSSVRRRVSPAITGGSPARDGSSPKRTRSSPSASAAIRVMTSRTRTALPDAML